MINRCIFLVILIIFLMSGPINSPASFATDAIPDISNVIEIYNYSDILVLINKENLLPSDYFPEDLRPVALPSVKGKDELREMAASALESMFKDAAKEGHILFAQSGFRSYDRQSQIFYGYVKKYGRTTAETFSAPPGKSEHQTGLAMDISSKATNYTLTKKFGELPEGKWIKENSWKYGFIIRYPEDKTSITKYTYEPWHLRYVGLEAAKEIHKRDTTLEEYLDSIKWKNETFGALTNQIILAEPESMSA